MRCFYITIFLLLTLASPGYSETLWEWAKRQVGYGSEPIRKESPKTIQDSGTESGKSNSNGEPSYSDFSKSLCSISVADWINSTQIATSISYSSHSLSYNPTCFSHMNTFQERNVWIVPSYFHSTFKDGKSVDFDLDTVGIHGGAGFTLGSMISMNASGGYYYSRSQFKHKKSADVHGVHLGGGIGVDLPQLELNAMLMGVGSTRSGKMVVRQTHEKKDPKEVNNILVSLNNHSWDVLVKVAGVYHYSIPESIISNSTLHPFLDLDYTANFVSGCKDFNGWHTSYLSSLLGTKLSKVITCNKRYILVPKLSLGWLFRLQANKASIKIKEPIEQRVSHKIRQKNQIALGAEVTCIQTEGVLFSVDYSSHVGANAPLQAAHVRIEWSW